MGIKINQKNAANESHGYFDNKVWKVHFYNGIVIGYYESKSFQCHFLSNGEIGYERHNQSQYLYNKPGKKFGEMITWK